MIQSLHHLFMIHDMVVVGTGPEPQPGCYLVAAAFSGAHTQLGSQVKNAVETDSTCIRAAHHRTTGGRDGDAIEPITL